MTLRDRCCAWGELLRLPNLFTVPGDPLVGYLLGGAAAGMQNAWPAMVAAVALYAAGLIFNDVADVVEDARDRPTRPLPSGRVSRRAAIWAGSLVGLAGVGIVALCSGTAFLAALGLLVLVLAYDFVTRRWRWLGWVNMGLCRGVSVWLGAVCAGGPGWRDPAVLTVAGGITAYVVAVSWLAADETRGRMPAPAWGVPAMTLAVLWMALYVRLGPFTPAAGVAMAGSLVMAVQVALWPGPSAAAGIGRLIRTLLVIQAAACLVAGPGGMAPALVLLVAWPLATLASRRFHGS